MGWSSGDMSLRGCQSPGADWGIEEYNVEGGGGSKFVKAKKNKTLWPWIKKLIQYIKCLVEPNVSMHWLVK